jgi:hypothetical protein
MLELVKRLQIEVQSKLDKIDPRVDPIKGYDQKMIVVKDAVMELKHYVMAHPFPDKSTEIQYFKHWLPHFLQQHVYFNALFDLEWTRANSSSEVFYACLEYERERVAEFFNKHRDLYFYYIRQEMHEDELLFVRTPFRDASEVVLREENYCQASFILSELLAYEKYKTVLNGTNGLAMPQKIISRGSKLNYVGTKAEAVELITLIHEAKLFDNTMEQLIESFEDNTGIDLKDFTIIDNNNRARKKSVNPLLDKFIRTAKMRMTRLNP